MRPSSNLISDNESRHVEFYSGELLYALWGKGAFVRQKMLIERIGAVSGYNSHKEIDLGEKLALPALLADFRVQTTELASRYLVILDTIHELVQLPNMSFSHWGFL